MHKQGPDRVRFWSRVKRGSAHECWDWPGTGGPNGYGVFRVGSSIDGTRSQVLAHRFAAADAFGPIPKGAHVLHSCDRPKCVNPAHLRFGTHQENMAEKIAKGRQRAGVVFGSAHKDAKLTPEAVLEIRASSETTKSLARRFGVTQQALGAARKGLTWRHVNGPSDIRGVEDGGS